MKPELPHASNKEIADEKIGKWLSAALEDPTTCGAMKDDINEWFQAIEEKRLRSKKKLISDELSDTVKMVMSEEDSDYNQEVPCKKHPDAPHGFLRNESLTQNRYVCECEYWEPEEILVECCDGGGPVGAGCYHDHCTGPKTKPEVLHAEANALTKLARSAESGEGATLFITHSPCIDCAKLIVQSGIREVYYGEVYRRDEGLEFLSKCGIPVIKL